MKRYLLLVFSALLVGCAGDSLPLEKSVNINGREYLLLVASSPLEPVADEPFSLRIEVVDVTLAANPAHLTYEVEITDVTGRRVFVESFHAMKGAPYERSLSLREGKYTLKLLVTQGMPPEFATAFQDCCGITEIYKGKLRFSVGTKYPQ